MNIGTMIATLGVDTKGLVAANAAMSNFQKNTLTSLSTLSQKFRTFGYLAGAAITLPIVMAAKATFNAAKEYEYSMQKIVGLTGVAQGAVNAWSEELLKLGPKYGKGPQELGEALYFVSSSGIQGARALDVVEISAKAAASGLGKTQDVADLLTSSLNAYAGTGLTAAYATDIMVAAVRVGKIEADQFASAVGQVIPIASAMGVELDQVAGGMAAMSLTGSSASQAATYLKGILNGLWKESTKGKKALDGMNSSYAELRQILGEQGLVPLLQKIRDMSLEYGDTLASKLFPNIRALTGYLSIAGKNFKYNTEIMQEVTESVGALGTAWAAVSETIKIKYDQAISAAQVSMIKLGKSVAETVLPILGWLVNTLENLTARFDAMSEAEKRNKIIKLLLIAVAGPLALILSVIGYTITGIISILIGFGKSLMFITHIIRALTGSTAALNAAMTMNKGLTLALMNPYVAIIALIAALTGGYLLLRHRVKETSDELTHFQKLIEDIAKLREDQKTIGEKFEVLFAMNPRQLEEFKNEIDQAIKLQEDALVTQEAYRKTWLDADAGYLNMRKKLAVEEENLAGWEAKIGEEQNWYQAMLWREGAKAQRKAIKEYITNRESWIDAQVGGIKEQIATNKMMKRRVEEIYDPILLEIKRVTEETRKLKEEQEDITAIFDKLTEGEYSISRMTTLLGDVFDTAKEKTKLYNSILRELSETTIPSTDKRLKELARTIQTLSHQEFFKEHEEELKKTAAPVPITFIPDYSKLLTARRGGIASADITFMAKFRQELDLIALKNKTLGGSFNTAREQISYFKTMLNFLWDEGLRPGTPLMDDLVNQMDKLITTAESAEAITRILTSAFTDMAFQVGSVFVEAGKGMQGMVDIVLQGAQQIVAALLSIAIARKLARPETATPWGLIVAAVGIGALMSLWNTAKAEAQSAARMVQGGVVPAGYPNDTYPARLTSGETVTPPGKLNNIRMDDRPMRVIFEGRLVGKDMYLQQMRYINELNSNT